MSKFSTQLLNWWDKHGRKDLPWQHPARAYRVWVSEIMLQQTQVKTVIPYFNRFMQQFPDIQSLAAVSNDDVLAYWSGLGYYARARNLLKTAKICMESHDADLPKTPEALAALPGIGESTANAIYSQAFDKPAVILDGNVKRVLARYFAVEGWPGKAGIHKRAMEYRRPIAASNRRGADYTQAIMDLGATLCTRTRPACKECPVNGTCKAYGAGTVEQFPSRRPALKISKKSCPDVDSFETEMETSCSNGVRPSESGAVCGHCPQMMMAGPVQQRLGLIITHSGQLATPSTSIDPYPNDHPTANWPCRTGPKQGRMYA